MPESCCCRLLLPWRLGLGLGLRRCWGRWERGPGLLRLLGLLLLRLLGLLRLRLMGL